MTAQLPPPVPLSMLICDAIHQDPSTGKKTLLGLFSELGAQDFPVVHPQMFVHIELTDCSGQIPVKLQLVDVDETEAPIFEAEIAAHSQDRRAILAFVVAMQGIAFPGPGEYRLQLFARNEFIMERRLLVRKVG